jgi:hypothetical protein
LHEMHQSAAWHCKGAAQRSSCCCRLGTNCQLGTASTCIASPYQESPVYAVNRITCSALRHTALRKRNRLLSPGYTLQEDRAWQRVGEVDSDKEHCMRCLSISTYTVGLPSPTGLDGPRKNTRESMVGRRAGTIAAMVALVQSVCTTYAIVLIIVHYRQERLGQPSWTLGQTCGQLVSHMKQVGIVCTDEHF